MFVPYGNPYISYASRSHFGSKLLVSVGSDELLTLLSWSRAGMVRRGRGITGRAGEAAKLQADVDRCPMASLGRATFA